ncbi:MAG: UvrD-helicase domain-containing protein [Bordetella sp.]|uniref:UvrD-helicase domain-containing protein n=1 Tax=Bordetella sp. TaxID=28081 RepID=UPI003F7CA590
MNASRRPSDHAARLRALNPAESFLVQAPAGSGKTELLTDRILALLATVSRPEEIVAITFTRKAASEMHARVLGKLAEARGPAPESEHARRSWELARAALERDAELGWQLLHHPARLAIRTIDSFCASLVRGMPCLSGLGGMPELASDPEIHYAAAARATLAYAEVSDQVRALIEHMDVDVNAACEAIAGMLAQRDQWMLLLKERSIDRESLERTLAEAVSADMRAVARAMPLGWQDALREPAHLAAADLEDAASNPLAALRDWHGDLTGEAAQREQWLALAHLLLTKDGGLRSPKGVNKNLGFPSGCAHKAPFTQWLEGAELDASRWTGRLHALRSAPPACFSEAQWRILSAQLLTLQLAVMELHKRFAESGEVDFIEIAQRAQQALGSADDPGELLLKLDASIRHLLVDEFQDTSLTQIHLLVTLTAGWQPGDGRTLFLVGDPMQSIYRFRKAEVGLFLDAAERGIGEIPLQRLTLTDNFRSQAGVVDWVNATFQGLFPRENDAAAGAIRYTRSEAFNPAMDGQAVQFHIGFGANAPSDADAQAEDTVVALVRQALAQAKPESRHPVAILVRARGHLGKLARRLADEGIACRAVDLVPLARREVVADLVQLMRALAHPADRLAWLSVLRAPWCGLKLDTLHALFGNDLRTPVPALLAAALRTPRNEPSQERVSMPQAQRGLWDVASEPCRAEQVLDPDEWLRLRRVADILLDAGNDSGALPWAAWIESLWQRLGGAALYAEGSADDAESLFALIERLAPHGGLDLARLDAALERLFAAPASDAAQDGSDAPARAVEIMTMHKSKGLQFDTVILYGLHRKPAGDRAPLVRIEQNGDRVLFGPVKPRAEKDADPISRYLALREQRRSDYEVDRLLYVAATRARHALHLVANVSADPKTGQARASAAGSLLARLWDAVPPEQKQPPPGDAQAPAEQAPAVSSQLLRRLAPEAVAQLAARDWRPGNPGFGVPTPGAQLWWQDSGQPAWQQEETYDAAIGTLAHAWLARVGADGLQAWPPDALRSRLPLMSRQLTRAGVPQSLAGQAAGIVLETLLATLDDERGRWLLSQSGARREWPLIDASGKVSVIDLAVSTEGGWLIVDYKTGLAHPGESPADFAWRMRRRHGDQLERYCRSVTSMDGRPAQAALYFPRARAWIEF